MNPDYRPGVSYGDRYDAAIIAGILAGQTRQALAASLGISQYFVSRRARALGHGTANKPQLHRRCAADFSRPIRRAAIPSRAIALTITGRTDKGPSRLARELRGRIIVLDRDGLDPSHGVACLHAAGLTLSEIERLTGVPVPAVVAAIRAHPSLGAAPEARP